MQWRHWLRVKSRDQRALAQMVALVLAVGALAGGVADWACAPSPEVSLKALDRLSPWRAPPQVPPLPEDAPQEDEEDSLGPERSTREPWKSIIEALHDAESAAQRSDWGTAWRGVWRVWLLEWRLVGPAVLASITSLCWLAFLIQSLQPSGWRDVRWVLCAAALALGTLSTGLTHLADLWQETSWGLREKDELAAGLRYYLVGVGLREEASKLLCALPFLPWLVRRRDELGTLLVFGCSGLGFALGENIGYVSQSLGSATLVRLLMPAPLHMALTGLAGLALYRACRWPTHYLLAAFATLAAAVLVHGMYDAFLTLSGLQDVALGAFILFVGLMMHFFRELRALRSRRSDPISLTANFLFCVSVTAAATFVYLSATLNWLTAADVLVHSLLTQAVMVYLFLREMPEALR